MTNFGNTLFLIVYKIRSDVKKFTRNVVLFQFEINPIVPDISKILDMSKKTLLTSKSLSKDIKMLWVIKNSWLIQESPGWKPDWFLEMKYG